MAKVSTMAKIEKTAKTMEARHSFSTILKNAGVSPYYIKEKLGHAILKTTENYFGGFEDEQQKEASNIINRFKAKFKNDEKYLGINDPHSQMAISKLEQEIDKLSHEQIATLLEHIDKVIRAKKSDGGMKIQKYYTTI